MNIPGTIHQPAGPASQASKTGIKFHNKQVSNLLILALSGVISNTTEVSPALLEDSNAMLARIWIFHIEMLLQVSASQCPSY